MDQAFAALDSFSSTPKKGSHDFLKGFKKPTWQPNANNRIDRHNAHGCLNECEPPAPVHEIAFLGRQPIGYPIDQRLECGLG
jgi:hypothetical protein